MSSNSNSSRLNSVFYAEAYHPIQAGSIDGTDILPHDNAVYRALLCSSAGLYDPFGDPKVIGDPYCTLFVGRLSRSTNEDTVRQAMSRYGRVKNLRLVRDIVTGASRGYAFVEYETEREMRRAYEGFKLVHVHANPSRLWMHTTLSSMILKSLLITTDNSRCQDGSQEGGGLGGKKESGQLRFGGRERPFRAPLRPIPYEDLKRLGIPPPPEGRYMSRFEVPSPPRRKRESRKHLYIGASREGTPRKREASPRRSRRKRNSVERETSSHRSRRKRNSVERETSPFGSV